MSSRPTGEAELVSVIEQLRATADMIDHALRIRRRVMAHAGRHSEDWTACVSRIAGTVEQNTCAVEQLLAAARAAASRE